MRFGSLEEGFESNPGISIAKKDQMNIDLGFTFQEGDTLEKLLMNQGYSRREIYDKGILDQVVRENKRNAPNCIPVGTEISLPTKHPKIKAQASADHLPRLTVGPGLLQDPLVDGVHGPEAGRKSVFKEVRLLPSCPVDGADARLPASRKESWPRRV